ncbi:hypothetical protein BEL04_00620 [Mucilaginibacter sp. PPCGB 2223]|uniref:SMI1/KNR4 family protein n=1 Tax=Mucilaginibacter sp. PPCGB 2223 TaxID=1886027 RepID=UPI0008258763|nr:SMI1/KNR4 family protein [Mucilaginibacter sp. PPCGB 2223]OCX52868.1 hypothetical protein BEL04_00620 [Mucilaginibacter sp. PPCGB 2223]
MYKNLEKLREDWGEYNAAECATEADIAAFEQRTGLLIPEDLRAYFKTLNGNNNNWDKYLVEFYSLNQFLSVYDEVGDFCGVPDFTNIVNTLPDHEYYYVFANYSIHVFVYAIRLSKIRTNVNEIYIICGDKYKLVANSFDEYIGKYVNEIDNYF